jgi:mono/diheme cytochrome c family protein
MRRRFHVLAVIWGLASVAAAAAAEPPPAADAHAAARALVIERCAGCHGADAQESGLRLDSHGALLRGGDFGPVVTPGRSAESELVTRIASRDDDERMPPDGPPLSAEETALIAAWIDAGLPWPGGDEPVARDPRLDHWAWQPLTMPAVPDAVPAFAALPGVEPAVNPIDHFVRVTLAARGLTPSPVADRRTLIRRVSFDLVGLPPTPEEVDAFVADPDPRAYDRLVERLLASPRHGERWARHWLDVVHYGDTHGYDKDKPRPHAWPYRDWVIASLNADLPYARFMAHQIAGDVLAPESAEALEATGFIAAGPWDFIGHVEVPETKTDGKIARHLDRDDMVANTIGTFASVTVHCAQCHAHKFDPVPQEDYYALQAVFAALDRGERTYARDPAVAAAHAALDARQATVDTRRKELDAAVKAAAGPRFAEIDAALAKAGKAGNPGAAYGWHSAIEPTADVAKWVALDLGREVPVATVVLHPCSDDFNGIGAGFGFPVRYRVEGAADADFTRGLILIADQTAADAPNPGTVAQVFPVGAAIRHLRVTATKLAPRKDDFIAALAELEALDDDGANLARMGTVTSGDSIEAPPRWQRANLVDGAWPAEAPATAALAAERARLLEGARAPHAGETAALDAEAQAVAAARKELPALATLYTAHARGRGGVPRTIQLLGRGNVNAPVREVGPGTLSLVAGLPARFELSAGHGEGERRRALADWLTAPGNPLPWRSIVNRVWHYHFGRGIVDTPSDFGRMGGVPSHPELLDWLAVTFRDGGGSLKDLHRLIVSSATYRQQSLHRADAAAVDAGGVWLWRQHPRRLEAEAIRDAVLSVAGTLDPTMGGPGWQDFRIEHPEHSPHYRYDLADPLDRTTWRRSVYRFIVRSQTQPFMTSLDCADPSMRVEKRTESLSAIQALALLNNRFMTTQAEQFAGRVAAEAGEHPRARIAHAFRLALGRAPGAEEEEVLGAMLAAHSLPALCRALFNLNEFTFID